VERTVVAGLRYIRVPPYARRFLRFFFTYFPEMWKNKSPHIAGASFRNN
jgi:hypothetical protein